MQHSFNNRVTLKGPACDESGKTRDEGGASGVMVSLESAPVLLCKSSKELNPYEHISEFEESDSYLFAYLYLAYRRLDSQKD